MKFLVYVLLSVAINAGAVTVAEGESTSDGALLDNSAAEYVAQNILGTPSCGNCQAERNKAGGRISGTSGTLTPRQANSSSNIVK